jgi:hypothetical protein
LKFSAFGNSVSILGSFFVIILSEISVPVLGNILGSAFNNDFHSCSSSSISFLIFSSNSSYFLIFSFTFSLSTLGFSSSSFGFSQHFLSYLLGE